MGFGVGCLDGVGLDDVFEVFFDCGFWYGVDDFVYFFVVFEYFYCGDGGDVVFGCEVWVFVDVQFGDVDFVVVFFGDFVEYWCDCVVWVVLGCLEVDEYGDVVLQYDFVEGLFVDDDGF